MSEVKLKPCPFCGNRETTIIQDYNKPVLQWEIQCVRCGCGVGYYKTQEDAIAAWNRREAARGDCKKCEEGDGDDSCPYYGEPSGCNDYYEGK